MCDLRRARVSCRLVFLPGGRAAAIEREPSASSPRKTCFHAGMEPCTHELNGSFRFKKCVALQASVFPVCDLRRAQVIGRLVFLPAAARRRSTARAFGRGDARPRAGRCAVGLESSLCVISAVPG